MSAPAGVTDEFHASRQWLLNHNLIQETYNSNIGLLKSSPSAKTWILFRAIPTPYILFYLRLDFGMYCDL